MTIATPDHRRRLRRILEGHEHPYAEEQKVTVPRAALEALLSDHYVTTFGNMVDAMREAARYKLQLTAARKKLGLVEGRLADARGERDAAQDTLTAVREALSAHPRCERHALDAVVTCGWKMAVLDIQEVLA
ncbi:hypothetical protein SEA_GRETCHEN_63 [Microbacterium phage Gretchen]|uniref:Uncharacterized protein n=1 Tax=Microbacterium phage Percival TaxID=2201439 RepID=A0A2Z4Q707_9CAUD|nr:hypothetical protein PBI_PERCIVAL_64 [Microbacterium phage Percival]UDL14837.1 hypothetical protein SEA_GRETCHEN_63 [Microbacterium phage Gretchen]